MAFGIPPRRLALRRSKDCEAHGALVPGFTQAGIRRAGSPLCCDDTGRATFKRVTLRRAGEVHTCGSCLSYTFPNAPYTAPPTVPVGSVYQVVDIATLDLTSFGPGVPYWRASLTFESPVNWAIFRVSAAIYLGNGFLVVGDTAPPLLVNQVIGPINYSTLDPGPALATTTVTSPVLQTVDVPRTPLQLRLVILTGSNRTTVLTAASFEICDDVFT